MLQSKQPMKLQSSLSTKWMPKPTREKQEYNAPQKRAESKQQLREAKRSNWV
jgi:hypothetical protein